jgi:LCP family protein required for cell wall assembly
VATSELGTTAWRRGPGLSARRWRRTVAGGPAARGPSGWSPTWRSLAPSGWTWRQASLLLAVTVGIVLLGLAAWVIQLDRSVARVEVDGLGVAGGGGAGSGPAAGAAGGSADGPAGGPAGAPPSRTGGEADATGPATDRHLDDVAPPTSEDAGSRPDDGAAALEVDVEEPVGDPLTVLVVGSDTREVLTQEERRRLRTGDFWGERTEVVALVRLDPGADTLRVLHVPRDTAVERCDGTRGRINAAHAIGERDGVGGLTCLVRTLAAWSGLTIDHLVKVDFRGFIDIVDAIGGVELELEAPLRDDKSGLDLPAGPVRLDGEDALSFVRARHLDDDFGRIARQQRFLREVQTEIRELGVLRDVGRLVRLAEAVAGSVELDDSLTLWRLRALVVGHRDTVAKPLDSRTVPGVPDTSSGAWLLQPDEQAAEELFAWLVTGEEVGAAAADAPRVPGHAEPPAGAVAPDPGR